MELHNDVFTCGQCQSSFNTLSSFITHKISHAESDAVILCVVCNRQFSEQRNYEQHLQQMHAVCISVRSFVDAKSNTVHGSAHCTQDIQTSWQTDFMTSNAKQQHITDESSHCIKHATCKSVFSEDSNSASSECDIVSSDGMLNNGSSCNKNVENIVKGTNYKTNLGYCDKQNESIDDKRAISEWLPNSQSIRNSQESTCVLMEDDVPEINSDNLIVSVSSPSSFGQIVTTEKSVDTSTTNRTLFNISLKGADVDSVCSMHESNAASKTIPISANQGYSDSRPSLSTSYRKTLLADKNILMSNTVILSKEPSYMEQELSHVTSCQSSVSVGKNASKLYTHMRSLLSSPLLTANESEKSTSYVVQSAQEKNLPGHVERKDNTHSCPPLGLSSDHSVTFVTSQNIYMSQSLDSCQSTVNSISSFSQCHLDTITTNSLSPSSESNRLVHSKTTSSLAPAPVDLSITSTVGDTLCFSHPNVGHTTAQQAPSLVSTVSSFFLPIVNPGSGNSVPGTIAGIPETLEKSETKIEEDNKNICSNVQEGKTVAVCSDLSIPCNMSEKLISTNSNTDKIEKEVINTQQNTIRLLGTSAEEDSIPVDFYFLLGTMNIQGTSLTYDRIDFRCLHCTFSTAWRPSLVKHMKYFHKDAFEIHKILDIRNTEPPDKDTEESQSNKCRKFQVMKMSEYLAGNQKSRKRVRKLERQDIPGKYHCLTCLKVFNRLRYLRRHQATHLTERAHLCDNCGKSFKTKAILVAHRRSHKTKVYHCPQCSFMSCSSAAIHMHRQLHPNGSVICDICGTAYMDKSTLNKHRKVHDLSRPFPCTYSGCTWRFKTDVMRKAHVRSHTTVGKFHCPHCGYNFRQKHHLHRHIAKIHVGQHIKNGNLILSVLSSDDGSPNLSAPSSKPFDTKIFSDGHPSLASAGEQDLVRSSDSCHDLLAAAGSLHSQNLVSIPASHLLCATSDTSYTSNLAENKLAMIEVLVGEKLDSLGNLEEEERASGIDTTSGSLSHLEYITENGEIVQLVRPGQTYMGRDQYGNLVQYKIADFQNQDSVSNSVCYIGVDGTVLSATNSQDQTLEVNSNL